jgi:hypothetical protein
MPLSCKIDDVLYSQMLDYMQTLMQGDVQGEMADISFYNDDFWLQDTVVIENVEYRNGEWNIFLVFAHHLLPLKLIKRKIKNLSCPKKAALTAHYMRRLAAKDQRGTLQLNAKLLTINFS